MYSKSGYIHGTGSALNVSLGWVPNMVEIWNATDGDTIHTCFIDKVIVFTSGGDGEVKKGDTLTGATSGATAKIRQVILDSGTWAGGDAAGWFICDVDDINGTIQSENVNQAGSGTQDNIATVVVDVEFGVDIDTEVAGVTGNAGCLAYAGTVDYSPGFTVGSTISEDGKLLYFRAFRHGPGEDSDVKVAGNTQADAVW